MTNEEFTAQLERIKADSIKLGRMRLGAELIHGFESKAFSEALRVFREMPAGEGTNLYFISMISDIIRETADK